LGEVIRYFDGESRRSARASGSSPKALLAATAELTVVTPRYTADVRRCARQLAAGHSKLAGRFSWVIRQIDMHADNAGWHRVCDLVGSGGGSDQRDWLVIVRTDPGLPAVIGIGLIVTGVVILNVYSKAAAH
jgi:hypothetical protein